MDLIALNEALEDLKSLIVVGQNPFSAFTEITEDYKFNPEFLARKFEEKFGQSFFSYTPPPAPRAPEPSVSQRHSHVWPTLSPEEELLSDALIEMAAAIRAGDDPEATLYCTADSFGFKPKWLARRFAEKYYDLHHCRPRTGPLYPL